MINKITVRIEIDGLNVKNLKRIRNVIIYALSHNFKFVEMEDNFKLEIKIDKFSGTEEA